jgi:hypothetical protein
MSLHQDQKIDYVFEVLEKLAKKYQIRTFDQEEESLLYQQSR